MIKKALNIIKQFRKWRLKRKIMKKMLKQYEQNYELELILEKWIVKRILDGQVGRRAELAEKQQRLKEIKLFIEYFKNNK